ncbi:hypothetical protein PSYMP_08000 [Pseudomonas amygdali pv. morsprunorum str. M302280]|nr:hypothetical protein PSYMP_08000 [Pseudomonas amygdali pv. morsprunorum str. M302280]
MSVLLYLALMQLFFFLFMFAKRLILKSPFFGYLVSGFFILGSAYC